MTSALSPRWRLRFVCLVAVLGMAWSAQGEALKVELQRLPEGGMQPVAVTDSNGTVHLVWLQGDSKASDVYYQALPGGRTNETAPIRVNSQPRSAIALGTVRGARLAVGRNGGVYIIWNGSSESDPESKTGVPVLFSRLRPDGKSFEPQRSLSGQTADLDGGAAIAADGEKRVFAVWHAQSLDAREGESQRRVFLAESHDDGATFGPERAISLTNGVCGCCGLAAFTSARGDLFVLYRAAYSMTNRPMVLLSSTNHGVSFRPVLEDSWAVGGCPMSTAGAVTTSLHTAGAWETRKRIEIAVMGHDPVEAVRRIRISEGSNNKHPALAESPEGEFLCTWAEGTGWAHGGGVEWRLLTSQAAVKSDVMRREGLPTWSFPAAYYRPGSGFVVVY